MNKKQIENRIQSAFTSATPNNLQSIQADCQRVPQQTTRRTNFMTKRWKIAAMALAMVLVVAAVFGAVDLSQNAYAATVTIDVNPSISIEIDGKQHLREDIALYDAKRTEVLKQHGLTVLRFTNTDINNNFSTVCNQIDVFVQKIINNPNK